MEDGSAIVDSSGGMERITFASISGAVLERSTKEEPCSSLERSAVVNTGRCGEHRLERSRGAGRSVLIDARNGIITVNAAATIPTVLEPVTAVGRLGLNLRRDVERSSEH